MPQRLEAGGLYCDCQILDISLGVPFQTGPTRLYHAIPSPTTTSLTGILLYEWDPFSIFQQDPSLYVFGVAARNFSLRLKRSLSQGGVLSKEVFRKEVLSKPQVATALLRIKPVVVQVKQTLTFHLPGAVERCAKLAPATCHTLKILPADFGPDVGASPR